jgi:DNA-binding CsgD family transcriptional regulator
VPDEDKSLLLNMLGIFYMDSNRMAESEEMLDEALAIRRARTSGDQNAIEAEIATVYNGLGNLYYFTSRYEEAIEAHRSAMDIRTKLAERKPDRYEEFLAYTYINLSAVFDEVQKHNESIELTKKACSIFQKLSQSRSDPHDPYILHDGTLAQCYQSLGVSYSKLERYDEAEEQFCLALEINHRLADANPGAYEIRVAEDYIEFGRMCLAAKQYEEAEEKLCSAKELYDRLARRAPDAYEPELAKCHEALGELYKETKRYTEAAGIISSAIKLYEKRAGTNPVFIGRIDEAAKLLASVNEAIDRQDRALARFTPEEKEVALLLTEGKTKSEIIRKLRLSAADANSLIKSIREKISESDDPDPVIDAVAAEYMLTNREAEMLKYLQRKAGNELIASELFVTDETVRKHVRALLKKLSIDSRQDVPAWLDAYTGN